MGPRQSPTAFVIAMLTFGKLTAGNAAYCLQQTCEGYYLQGGEPDGLYLSTDGNRFLHLSGKVSKEDLHALFQGFRPNGKPLVQNAGTPDRSPGWDATFSVPKHISIIWSVSSPEVRQAIQKCALSAVSQAVSYLEREASFSRRGKAGHEIVPARIVAAAFEHSTSRGALDPQLHTHVLIVNVGIRSDNSTGSLQSKPFYEHKMVAGAIYRAHLAQLLRQELGLQVTRKGTSFEVAGVPEDLTRHFSTRRRDIEQHLKDKGLSSAAAASVAALETREKKQPVPPRSELFKRWQETAARFGFTPERASQLLHRAQVLDDPKLADRAVDRAINAILERSTSFDHKTLLCHTLYAGVEHGLAPDRLRRTIENRLRNDTHILKLSGSPENPPYTTCEALRLQRQTTRSIEELAASARPAVSQRAIRAAIANHAKPRDSTIEELKYHIRQLVRAASKQKTWRVDRDCIARSAKRTADAKHLESVTHITRSQSRLSVLRKLSPDDRYLTLTCCREAWERSKCNVIGVSLSRAGVKRLYQETGIESVSLRGLELRMHPTTKFRLKHHARQLWRAAREKPTYNLKPLKIDKDTVLVVDGAEQLTCQQMASLTRDVARQGGRLVLVEGDRSTPRFRAPTPFDTLCEQLARSEKHEHSSFTQARRPEDPPEHHQSRTL